MTKHTVAVAGLGPRGRCHVDGLLRNPDRFNVVAVCDLDEARLVRAAEGYGISAAYTDADTMLAETTPDVFCFATLPNVRLPLVKLAAKHGVKAVAFEKPMAT